MDKEYFLIKDKIQDIESNFVKDGWINAYVSCSKSQSDQCVIYL
jgi:hypothetical protein